MAANCDPQKKLFSCDQCNKEYIHVSGLRRHLKVTHKLIYHIRGSPTPVPVEKLAHIEKQAKKDGRGGRQRRQEMNNLVPSISNTDAVSDETFSVLIDDLMGVPPINSSKENSEVTIYEDISDDSRPMDEFPNFSDVGFNCENDIGDISDFTAIAPFNLQELNTPCVSPIVVTSDSPIQGSVLVPDVDLSEPRVDIPMMSIPSFTPLLRHADSRYERVVLPSRLIPATGAVLPGGLTYNELKQIVLQNTSRKVSDILLSVERVSPIEVDDSEIVTLSYVVRGILVGLGCAEESD